MYDIGDKFEIEINRYFIDENNNRLYLIKGFNSLVFDEKGLNKLKKAKRYDVEDLAEAKREAYDRGYKWGVENTEKAYQAQAEKEKPKTVKASELAVDTKVICWNNDTELQYKRYFATTKNGVLYAFSDGRTSWYEDDALVAWEHMTLKDGTIVLPE